MIKIGIAAIVLIAGTIQAKANVASLSDWCVNLNGDINTACNGAGSGGGGISLASFDTTLEPSTNSLGTVKISLTPGANQFAVFYASYDVDFSTYGSFADTGAAVGALPAGYSYELADPNVSNIFNDFASVPSPNLPNTNTVGTPSGPPMQCCDVSFALAISGITVKPGGSGTVNFTVTAVQPATGFYLKDVNEYTGDSVYLQGTVQTFSPTVPEPFEFLPLLALFGGLVVWKRTRNRSRAV